MSKTNSHPLADFRIEDSVGYLLARSRTMLAKAVDGALAEYNITHAQGSILIRLAAGKSTTAADFARELYIDAASMTRMIDRLEKRGLLVREANPDDRRQFKLRLTSEGTTLAQKLPALYTATLNRSFSGFSAEELGFLKCLLRKLLANSKLSDEKNN